jgi:hypothetical protein
MGPLIYLAHPIRPAEGETIGSNLEAVGAIYRALLQKGYIVIAPYILPLLKGWERDEKPEDREAGLERAKGYVRCAGLILLAGPRISNGMAQEASAGRRVLDCTGFSTEELLGKLDRWLAEWEVLGF